MVGFIISYFRNGERPAQKALVVDCFTNITGSMSGSGSGAFGFSDSKMSGKTQSQRKYKVLLLSKHLYSSKNSIQEFEVIDHDRIYSIISTNNNAIDVWLEEYFKLDK